MCIAALSIGLVISACVLVHCLATKCWSADIKMPRSWEKRDKDMAIKWGVLGTAGIAQGCTIPGMQMAEGCELYAIAGRSETKVNEFKERFGFQKAYVGYDALLADKDVQAVYIPLPNHLHYEWVMKAIEAGKHVLCEKPLASNSYIPPEVGVIN